MPDSVPQLRQVDLQTDREAVFRLSVEYMAWVDGEINASLKAPGAAPLHSVEAYVARRLDEVCGQQPPIGAFYLVEHNGSLAGMCGLRQLGPGVAEFKRFYVRPAHRGCGLGQFMLQRLLADARTFGCTQALLDSAPFMQAAHRLYLAAGFTDCAPYSGAEVPEALHPVWRFMRRSL